MNTLAMKGKIQHLKNHSQSRQLSNSLNHDINELSKELRILEMSEDNNANIMGEENEGESEDEQYRQRKQRTLFNNFTRIE